MPKDNIDKVKEAFIKETKIENLLNRDGDQLPFGLYNPLTQGKLIWMCNFDEENKITSVFNYTGNEKPERKCTYLKNKEEAVFFRDTLIHEGWLPLKLPKIEFTMD
jgi:hypothetical protein